MKPIKAHVVLGLGAMILAALAISLWLPNDSATGLMVRLRGRTQIGDALAPTAAFVIMAVSGLMLLFERSDQTLEGMGRSTGFLAVLVILFAVSLLLMRWTGPLAVTIAGFLGDVGHSYRELRATFPWKHLGFATGGTFMVASLISLVEGRFTAKAVLVGALTVLGLILVFDLPFSDLLLPPNGDV